MAGTTGSGETTSRRKSRGKRNNGEGTFYQRGDGLWAGKIMVGYRPNGRPDIRTVSSKDRATA